MRRRILLGLAVAFAALTASLEPAISSNLDYNMINDTDQPIVRMWASPTTDPNWVESTGVYVPAGGSQQQSFDDSGSGSDCYYDIRIQFQAGDREVINHVDLCSITAITIDVSSNGQVTYDTTTSN